MSPKLSGNCWTCPIFEVTSNIWQSRPCLPNKKSDKRWKTHYKTLSSALAETALTMNSLEQISQTLQADLLVSEQLWATLSNSEQIVSRFLLRGSSSWEHWLMGKSDGWVRWPAITGRPSSALHIKLLRPLMNLWFWAAGKRQGHSGSVHDDEYLELTWSL